MLASAAVACCLRKQPGPEGRKQVGIYRVGRIEWETDGKSPELPRECTVECESEEGIAGVLSDHYGWLVATFVVLERSGYPEVVHTGDAR